MDVESQGNGLMRGYIYLSTSPTRIASTNLGSLGGSSEVRNKEGGLGTTPKSLLSPPH